jgi:Fe-S cluster assembly scaffold protein SufB
MVTAIINDLVATGDRYSVFHNGVFMSGNGPESLVIAESGIYKFIHLIDATCEIAITINPGLEVTLMEFYYCTGDVASVAIDYDIGAVARVELVRFKQGECAGVIRFITNTNIKENTYINNRNLSIISTACELTDNVYLRGKGGEIAMTNVTINTFGKEQNHCYDIHHLAPRTTSTLHNYGISKNHSLLNIKSNGLIARGAKKAELRQKSKGLIIGTAARLSADPILQIDEYDVIASHGASIGAINEDELYYLMSRGLTYESAEKLIVSGFVNPFFNGLGDDISIDYMKRMIDNNL